MAKAFTVYIELGNDAMQEPADVAQLLRKIADRMDTGVVGLDPEPRKLRDINGNTVGEYSVKNIRTPKY